MPEMTLQEQIMQATLDKIVDVVSKVEVRVNDLAADFGILKKDTESRTLDVRERVTALEGAVFGANTTTNVGSVHQGGAGSSITGDTSNG